MDGNDETGTSMNKRPPSTVQEFGEKITCETDDEVQNSSSKEIKVSDSANYSQKNTKELSKRTIKKMKRFQAIKNNKSNKGRKVEDRGYSKEIFSESEYYFEDGLRKVYPYYFTFTTHAKERWFNKTLIDVFSKEFLAETPEGYRRHIEAGKILVNGKRTNENYVLKNGNEIAHTIHRHENPVVGSKIEIIADTDDVLVINKPASIPCHPCGKYRHNSIVFILGKEYGYSNLRNIYRLDRLTSGVLILGKTVDKTKQLEDHILKRLVKKEYVCRVVGKFPDGVIKVDQPLACMRHNLTLWKVENGGKESQTYFERLSYNGNSSVVKCTPHTGRTHQIRVHLQYLGYPIVNDPFYNSVAWGPSKGKGGIVEADEKDVAAAILKEHNVGQWVEGDNPLYLRKLAELEVQGITKLADSSGFNQSSEGIILSGSNPNGSPSSSGIEHSESNSYVIQINDGEPPHKRTKLSEYKPSQPTFNEKKWNIDANCQECKMKYFNPQPKDLVLYLHARKYEGPDWSYEAPLPDWASDDWKDITVV